MLLKESRLSFKRDKSKSSFSYKILKVSATSADRYTMNISDINWNGRGLIYPEGQSAAKKGISVYSQYSRFHIKEDNTYTLAEVPKGIHSKFIVISILEALND